jgi:hypothetical protein
MQPLTTPPNPVTAQPVKSLEPTSDATARPRKLQIEALEPRATPGVVLTGAD